MDVLSVEDLADGAGRLTGAPEQAALVIVDLATATPRSAARAAATLTDRCVAIVGIADRPLPASLTPLLDKLTCTLAPGGPGRSWVAADDAAIDRIAATASQAPGATLVLTQLLPLAARATVYDGLQAESLAYSMLLAGPEFAAWRAGTPAGPPPEDDDPVLIDRTGDVLTLTLNRPERHNAFGRGVRDALIDALEIARLDDSVHEVVLRGAGRSFCSGGDLDEFGTAADPVAAHAVRLGRSAGWAVHRIRERVRARLHGACIGAGIEVPAFAARVDAADGTWFRLPELSMGLVPGAGGTVSMTHRIGPHRTAFMALTGDRIDLETALEWGLVDGRA
ncbi:enoyl-CoA hydratase/isomerase family protein [Nocardioides sp. BP30]|uniref:enoyl-CoA hydratase/isomerase family protein n=1 Tax=Nocardioides sp. BP30 TaxID=3036374 RepID=UPI0024685460|nr:enoyl-CoA hydratase/isomerase family protein [Nocardioides sp. BP30]WGL54030.1 enoyl-CoA hydratase/isomerase family protein [Nocardioides sp. BP30]